jgi:hypothetical protein
MLLPSDTYRKYITSIAAVSHPNVTYLLTLPRILYFPSKAPVFAVGLVGEGLLLAVKVMSVAGYF